MPLPEPDPVDPEPAAHEPEDSRESWLEVAQTDFDGGAAALATAARHGRPLPRRGEAT